METGISFGCVGHWARMQELFTFLQGNNYVAGIAICLRTYSFTCRFCVDVNQYKISVLQMETDTREHNLSLLFRLVFIAMVVVCFVLFCFL